MPCRRHQRALHAAGRTAEALEHIGEALKRAPYDPAILSSAELLRALHSGLRPHTVGILDFLGLRAA